MVADGLYWRPSMSHRRKPGDTQLRLSEIVLSCKLAHEWIHLQTHMEVNYGSGLADEAQARVYFNSMVCWQLAIGPRCTSSVAPRTHTNSKPLAVGKV